MWFGMAAYGRRTWDEHGNGFTVYFGLLARIAPFGEHEGRLVLRVPFSGLAGSEPTPGCSRSSPSCSARSGSTASAGPRSGRTCAPTSRRRTSSTPRERRSSSRRRSTLAGLLGCILLVALAYLAATKVAERMIQSDAPLAAEFLQSLVPIALVYAVAHYFTLLVIQGQYAWPLASDPFGFGWDLFGGVDYAPNIAPFSPNTVWYVQVGRARRRPRRRPRRRARPSRDDPAAARCASLPVRDARADGALHDRRAVAALAGLTPVVAHGGVGGAIIETLLAISIGGIFLAVYLRERRANRSRDDDDEA